MFCPQCKAEYRPGFNRCSDCEVDLVERLPKSHPSAIEPSESEMIRVWFCDERDSCVAVCSDLRAAGIPFRVAQSKRQFYWNVDEHYEIWVPAELYDRAKTIAEKGCLDFSDSDEDQKIMELPDPDSDVDQRGTKDRSSCMEDITVEVWTERAELKGIAWMVIASLRENDIDFQVNETRDGLQRIFVRPSDECQARNIVSEIETGTPPT